MGKTITKLVTDSAPLERTRPEFRVQIIVDFWGRASYKFKNQLLNLMKEYYPTTDVRVIFKASRTVGSFFSFKDKIPSNLQSGVVYHYSCGCCSASYIGQTSRHFQTRIYEHLGISPRTNKVLESPKYSAIREHVQQCNSRVDINDFHILHRASKWDLPLLETIFTAMRKPTLGCHEQSISTVCF